VEETFSHARDWLGGAAFRDTTVAHIERTPPSSWTLDAYPRAFPATLRELYPDDPEIAELAWLEFALTEAFVGPDASAVTAEMVAMVDWDTAILCFTPTLYHADLTTNATCYGRRWRPAKRRPTSSDCRRRAVYWSGATRTFHGFAIDRDESSALSSVRAGMTFGNLCERLVREHGVEAGVVLGGTLLGRWLRDQLICGPASDPVNA